MKQKDKLNLIPIDDPLAMSMGLSAELYDATVIELYFSGRNYFSEKSLNKKHQEIVDKIESLEKARLDALSQIEKNRQKIARILADIDA